MLKNIVIAFLISAAMIGTSCAFWQEPAPSRPNPIPGSTGPSAGASAFVLPEPTVTLLKTREVQAELKLAEDQAKKIDEITAEITRERQRLAAEYAAKITELNQKAAGEALGLLSDAQRRRTEQLRLQQQGLRAFSTNQVAEKLGLSQEQRDAIAKLNQRVSVFGRGTDRDRTANPPNPNVPAQDRFQQAVDEANKRAAETREKILAILTPEQKAKWSEMAGEPFKFPTPQWSTTRGTSTRSWEPAQPGGEKKDQ